MSDAGNETDRVRSVEMPRAQPRQRNWDAVTAMVAVFIGVLALLVSGYTAYLQRQQVRAEVWPNLLIGFYDPDQAIGVHNKGVGPAIVRSLRVWVDGKPVRSWAEVLGALGMTAEGYVVSTVSNTVISPGERVLAISVADTSGWKVFRDGMASRVQSEICYCSTLGECWLQSGREPDRLPGDSEIDQCPALPESESFRD
ncbi:hypothetical protein [Dokdonella sp.]|uniref:hypothetical protein n=1 Tax=Dokdonella sp. TaxID=2291710 RepID=UPI003528D1BC